MAAMKQLVREIESLSPDYIQEVINFVGYLKHKKISQISETMLLSEKSLAENWDTPEEDDLWAIVGEGI